MSISISRRSFVKCAAAASMSVALTGLLSGCGDNDEKPEEGGTGNGEGTEEPETPVDPPKPTYTVSAVDGNISPVVSFESVTLKEGDTSATIPYRLNNQVYPLSSGADYVGTVNTYLSGENPITGAAFTLFVYQANPAVIFESNQITIPNITLADDQTLAEIHYKSIFFSADEIQTKLSEAVENTVSNALAPIDLGALNKYKDYIKPWMVSQVQNAIKEYFEDNSSNSLSKTLRDFKKKELVLTKDNPPSIGNSMINTIIKIGWSTVIPGKGITIRYGEELFDSTIRMLVTDAQEYSLRFYCDENPVA